MSQAQSERRGAPRASADLPLQLSTTADARPAKLHNISETGLCCHFEEAVTEMTMMGVDLVIPGHEPQQVKGVVVRCERADDPQPPGYEVAIYFTDLEPQARVAIREFVADQLTQ